jgi:hypothetical protein
LCPGFSFLIVLFQVVVNQAQVVPGFGKPRFGFDRLLVGRGGVLVLAVLVKYRAFIEPGFG